MEKLTLRELNRATLARQLLLERKAMPAVEAVQRLAGLNAQYSLSPYISLWSRLVDFHRDELTQALDERKVTRVTLMRSTLHLVTKQDFLTFQPALQAVLLRAFRGYFREEAGRIDLDRLCAAAASYLAEEARTFPELRAHLESLEPDEDPASLSFAVRARLPLVQLPPAGTWRFTGSPRYILAERLFGQGITSPERGCRELLLRYLAAFGPATRRDIEAWSGLTGLRATVRELEPELRTFVDEQGQILLDVPDGPLPDPDAQVLPRFLSDWDNVLLAHADRTRVLPDGYRKAVIQTGGHVLATFLLDGFVAGLWKIERGEKRAVLKLTLFQPLPPSTEAALVEEGEHLLRFVEDEATTFAVELVR